MAWTVLKHRDDRVLVTRCTSPHRGGARRSESYQQQQQFPTVGIVGGSLPLQLEDDHPAVVPGGEQVLLGVRGQYPEAVVLATEGLHAHALADVPHL